MIIYKATNRENGKIYIGQTIGTLKYRKTQHLWDAKGGSNYHFHNALLKYGVDGFKWEVIQICADIDSLNEREQYYIAYYDSFNNGYNSQSGGLNYRASEETKEKMKEATGGKNNPRYGVEVSKETRGRMRKAHLNMSDEAKRKRGEAIRKRQMGKDNHNYGKHPSEKTKEKLRQASLKRWLGKKQNCRQCELKLYRAGISRGI